jgi:hypothetical protein
MKQPDDPGDLADYDEYIRRVARQAVIGMGNTVHNGSSSKLTNWLLTIMSILVAGEMVGGVGLYAKVESIDTTMQLLLAGKIVIVRTSDVGH